MKPIRDLILGYKDAENYRRRENKEFFNNLFLKNKSLDKLCDPSAFFLVGEKGTGKTAHAVYLANNNYHNNLASLRFIRETEYQKFLQLKKSKNLDLSDFTNIWKVIICLLMAQQIREKESGFVTTTLGTFLELEAAIDDYYSHAFSARLPTFFFSFYTNLMFWVICHEPKGAGRSTGGVTETGAPQTSHLRFELESTTKCILVL